MLILLNRFKIRRYRLLNLSLLDTLTFLCVPQPRARDILRLIRLGGSEGRLSLVMTRRLEEMLLRSAPGLLAAGVRRAGRRLALDLTWPDLTATLLVKPGQGGGSVDVDLTGRGEDVMEMARDAAALRKTA